MIVYSQQKFHLGYTRFVHFMLEMKVLQEMNNTAALAPSVVTGIEHSLTLYPSCHMARLNNTPVTTIRS